MSTIHLRERLDKLLMMTENSSDATLRAKVATILDIIPATLPEIQKDILVINKPKIKNMMGRLKPWRKDKVIRELKKSNYREDLFGQVCDLILRISNSTEILIEEQQASL